MCVIDCVFVRFLLLQFGIVLSGLFSGRWRWGGVDRLWAGTDVQLPIALRLVHMKHRQMCVCLRCQRWAGTIKRFARSFSVRHPTHAPACPTKPAQQPSRLPATDAQLCERHMNVGPDTAHTSPSNDAQRMPPHGFGHGAELLSELPFETMKNQCLRRRTKPIQTPMLGISLPVAGPRRPSTTRSLPCFSDHLSFVFDFRQLPCRYSPFSHSLSTTAFASGIFIA